MLQSILHYEIIEKLGEGGFGTTYLAVDTHLPARPRRVVKHLKSQNTTILTEAKRLFEQEANILYNLEHPQIPRLHAYFEEKGKFYLVQEYIEGDDLSQEIVPGARWKEDKTRELLKELLEILAFVHKKKIIHRDIKPANIRRRNRDGKLVLIDFGAVKEVVIGQTSLTVSIGSPGYISSEQANGRPKFASDVYSVGIIGIQVLTGLDPEFFMRDSAGEIIWRNHAQVSSHFADVLTKMVKDHFSFRYPNATEALQAIRSCSPSSPPLPLPTGNQSFPRFLLPLLVSLSVFVSLGVIFTAFLPSVRDSTSTPTLSSSSPNISLAQTLTGHSDDLVSVAISPDNRTIVSGSWDNTIKVWDLKTGTLKRTLTGHSDDLVSVAISPDNRTIVSGSSDDTIKVWDLETGTLKRTLTGHSSYVYSVAISPDNRTIVSGSLDDTIKVWDLETGTLKRTLTGHSSYVWSVAISADNSTIVSGSSDDTIKVWDLETGTLKRTLTGHSYSVFSVAISADNSTIVSGSSDDTIEVWDLETGTLKRTLKGHSSGVVSVAISADNSTIVSGSNDDTIKVWKVVP